MIQPSLGLLWIWFGLLEDVPLPGQELDFDDP